jgi:hypothetical protein
MALEGSQRTIHRRRQWALTDAGVSAVLGGRLHLPSGGTRLWGSRKILKRVSCHCRIEEARPIMCVRTGPQGLRFRGAIVKTCRNQTPASIAFVLASVSA